MPPFEDPMGEPRPSRAPLLSRLIATALFTGYVPWASGTVGSLAGLLVLLIPGAEQPLTLGLMILRAAAAGIPAAAAIARSNENCLSPIAAATKKALQPGDHEVPDPSIVVIDEVVGMWITLFLIPKTVAAYLLGFLLFRVMDILKPQPARTLEQIPNGWGIMLDDVVAAVYANVGLRLLLLGAVWIFPALAS
jgi:phosphatidylglycerophosphatase A